MGERSETEILKDIILELIKEKHELRMRLHESVHRYNEAATRLTAKYSQIKELEDRINGKPQ